MKALALLKKDIIKLKEKTVDLPMEEQLNQLLLEVGQEIIHTLETAITFRESMTFHKPLDGLLDEVEIAIENIHEIYSGMIEPLSKKVSLKHLFTTLDEEIGAVDDFVESFNELFETQDCMLQYVESWDIDFFIQNM